MIFSNKELVLIKKAIIIAKDKVKQENNIQPEEKRFEEISDYNKLIEKLSDI